MATTCQCRSAELSAFAGIYRASSAEMCFAFNEGLACTLNSNSSHRNVSPSAESLILFDLFEVRGFGLFVKR